MLSSHKQIIILALVSLIFSTTDVIPQEYINSDKTAQDFALPKLENWKGDFDGMMERRTIRIAVPYSKTLFFINKGREYGIVAELGQELERWINQREHAGSQFFRVVIIPKKREELIDAVLSGEADIAAGNLRVTDDALAKVDFSPPTLANVKVIVVTGPASPQINTLDDLAGTESHVRLSSSYVKDLERLNKKLTESGKSPVKIVPIDDNLDDEDIMEMVNAGILPYAVVNQNIGDLWQKIFLNTKARDDLALAPAGDVAWAFRKNSPLLKHELEIFVADHGRTTAFYNTFIRKHYGNVELIKNAISSDEVKKFTSLVDVFKKYGDENNFDYLLLAAQGFQESQLDQSRRSPRGAVGIMQLLPSTAASKPIEITDIDKSAEINIKAGARYMRHLRENYVNDPAVNDKNQMLMALAAYNAGPGNLKSFRAITKEMGLNPNIWFKNVERGAAKKVGLETVQYVSNIYKYYLAYRSLLEREAAQSEAKETIRRSILDR